MSVFLAIKFLWGAMGRCEKILISIFLGKFTAQIMPIKNNPGYDKRWSVFLMGWIKK